jgi:excisionase family DNA binding protein
MKHALLDYEVERPPQFAKLAGVSKPTIMSWIRSGKLKAHRFGTRYYIPSSELQRMIETSTEVVT